MIKVLTKLETLCSDNESYFYEVKGHYRGYNEMYTIHLHLPRNHRVVIASTPDDDLVDVWTVPSTTDDGVRVPKSALLEYLIYIIKAEFND